MTTVLTSGSFMLPGLEQWRRARTEQIGEVLGTSFNTANPSGRPITHAIAHHLLEGAEQAAHDRDEDLFAWYRRTGTRDLAYLLATGAAGTSTHLLLNPDHRDLLRSPLSETAYYLVRPDTAQAETVARDLLPAALDSAAEHGFGPLLEQHAPVICLLEHRDLADALFSWSITRLPGTVFTDYTDHHEILARDLIHEAGHHWLNDALALAAAELPEDVTFYSPWRRTERPVFGFLHACWAFSLTMIYSARALEHSGSAARTFLANYLTEQRSLLMDAVPTLTKAIGFIKDEAMRGRLASTVTAAMRS
ncbi:aKG-HExxH-type peptide beta-hydroxylase [Streptacidiphilus albus]|uniref:aKG-HExxH-type peptide beta-hydroxylase n=1 Tax=Streptacidiphilus albus TaxID=105425 RepID=UPI0006907F2C|nr:HEXXH motif-containing putative peptide modification protein [Streptacidiphilus albus]